MSIYDDVRVLRRKVKKLNENNQVLSEDFATDIILYLKDILFELKQLNESISKLKMKTNIEQDISLKEEDNEYKQVDFVPDFDFSKGNVRSKKQK